MPIISNGSNATIAVAANQILTVQVSGGAEFTYENPVGTRLLDSGSNNVFGPFASAGSVKLSSVIGSVFYEVATQPQAIAPFTPGAVSITGGAIGAHFNPAYNDALVGDAYGDSITFGVGASIPAKNYVSVVGSTRPLTITNNGISGTQAADGATTIFGKVIGPSQQSTMMFGTNDWRIYKGDANKQAAFKNMHLADAAWLAIPDTRKVKANGAGVAYSAGWVLSGPYGGVLYQSPTIGSTATMTLYGSVLYICSLYVASTATYSITVDGINQGTFTTAAPANVNILTQNNLSYGPNLIRLAGFSEGPHTVVITVLTADASNAVYFSWAAGNLGNVTKDGPNVWVGNIPRATAAYYTSLPGTNDALVATYNGIVRANVNALASDGLNVALVDSASVFDSAQTVDGVHPNDTGYAVLAGAFLESMNQIQKPRSLAVLGNVPSNPFTKVYLDYTNTATVGAVTINKAAGRVNIAAAGTSIVVTNGFVTAASKVFAQVSTADGTAYIKNVVPAAGSFTITLGAAATAQTSVDFFCVNAD